VAAPKAQTGWWFNHRRSNNANSVEDAVFNFDLQGMFETVEVQNIWHNSVLTAKICLNAGALQASPEILTVFLSDKLWILFAECEPPPRLRLWRSHPSWPGGAITLLPSEWQAVRYALEFKL